MGGIAAGVKTRDDKQVVIVFDNEKQQIGKPAQEGAASVFVDNRKLQRVGDHALDHGVNSFVKATAQIGRFAFIPVLRGNQFRPSGLSEANRIHFRGNAVAARLSIQPN